MEESDMKVVNQAFLKHRAEITKHKWNSKTIENKNKLKMRVCNINEIDDIAYKKSMN